MFIVTVADVKLQEEEKEAADDEWALRLFACGVHLSHMVSVHDAICSPVGRRSSFHANNNNNNRSMAKAMEL